MTRREKVCTLAALFALPAVALLATGGWQAVELIRASPHADLSFVPVLLVGLSAVFAVPAWGLWHERLWAWVLAGTLITLVGVSLAAAMAEASQWRAVIFAGFVVAAWLAYDTMPQPADTPSARADVDRVAAALGVRWEDHPLGRVGELVRAGQTDAAAKLYREAMGSTWDAAWFTVAQWDANEVERKLRALARWVEGPPPGPADARGEPSA